MKRNSAIDGIKAIAVIGIACFYHYGGIFCDKYTTGYGAYFTELMFEISGFFAFLIYRQKIIAGILSFNTFILYRTRRLLPGGIVSVVVMEIAQLIYYSKNGTYWLTGNIDLYHFVITLLGIHMWIGTEPCINGPIWFISVLLFQNIIFFILTKVSKKCGNYIYFLPVFWGMLNMEIGMNYPLICGWMSRGYCSFFSGVILGIVYEYALSGNTVWSKLNSLKKRLAIYAFTASMMIIFMRLKLVGNVSVIFSILVYPQCHLDKHFVC